MNRRKFISQFTVSRIVLFILLIGMLGIGMLGILKSQAQGGTPPQIPLTWMDYIKSQEPSPLALMSRGDLGFLGYSDGISASGKSAEWEIPSRSVGTQQATATTWLPVLDDAPIYEGQPDAPHSDDIGGWVGYFSGSDYLRERSLVEWDLYWLPENISVTDADMYLWLLGYTGSSTCDIATHRVTNWWWSGEATWNSRYSGTPWNTAGGDYASTPIATVSVITNSQWIWMGDATSLVTGWHDNTFSNDGVLYKGVNEGGSINDRLFALSGSDWQAPALGVDYSFNGSVEQLPANVPQTKSTPTGDHYFSHAALTDWKWRAYGIRPPSGADYDLYLYDNSEFYIEFPASISGKSSTWGTGYVDLVVIGRNAPQAVRYGRVRDWSGSGNYQVEFATATASLSGTGTFGPYAIDANSVLKVFEFSGTPDQNYRFTLSVDSGDADLGMMLCPSSSRYVQRAGCSAYSDSAGAGGTEQFECQVVDDGWHGLIVWNNGASSSTQFRLQVEPIVSYSYVYLPLTLRNYFVNPYEENDRAADAAKIPLNTDIHAYPDDDEDWYSFGLSATQNVTIRLQNYQANGWLMLYEEDGVTEIDKAYGTNEITLGSRSLAVGTYKIRIYTFEEGQNLESLYTLRVSTQ